MINLGWADIVIECWEVFEGLEPSVFALEAISAGQGEAVLFRLERFSGIDQNILAVEMIAAGQSAMLCRELYRLTAVDHGLIARKIIDCENVLLLAFNLGNFRNLPVQIGITLSEMGAVQSVVDNLGSFSKEILTI